MKEDIVKFLWKLWFIEEVYDTYNEDEYLVRNRNNHTAPKSKNTILDHFREYITYYTYHHIRKQKYKQKFQQKY